MEIFTFKNLRGSPTLRRASSFFILPTLMGCSILATRPIQEMSDTTAAIRAAKEVQADTLAPEYYRQSNEWFFQAKHEYKFKNFKLAKEYAEKARRFAEQAEFEALKNGGNRLDQAGEPDPLANMPTPSTPEAPGPSHSPYTYPTPEGTPADVYEQRKAEDDQKKAALEKQNKEDELEKRKAQQPIIQMAPLTPQNR